MAELLHEVVATVFPDDLDRVVEPSRRADEHRATVRSRALGRSVVLVAARDRFEIVVPELAVGAIAFAYEEDRGAKVDALAEIAELGLRYLLGEGDVERRRGLLRRSAQLTLTARGQVWRLRRFSHSVGPVDGGRR